MSDHKPVAPPCNVKPFRLPPRAIHSLPPHALCQLIGINVSDTLLQVVLADFGVDDACCNGQRHQWAVTACGQEGHAFGQWLSDWLNSRHEQQLQDFAQLQRTDALLQRWRTQLHGEQVAGALWALLSHARCTDALVHHAMTDLHLLGHLAVRERASSKRSVRHAQRAVQNMAKRIVRLQSETQRSREAHALEQRQWLQRLVSAQRQVVHLSAQNASHHNLGEHAVSSEQFGRAIAEIDALKRELTEEQQLRIA